MPKWLNINISLHHLKKMLLGWCFLFGILLNINAQQNLIPDPSFEQYEYCPVSGDFNNHFEILTYWYSPTYSSAYFHPCAEYSSLSVPYNGGGFQEPHSGKGYAGIVCVNGVFGMEIPEEDQYREYLATPLLSELVAGKVYYLEFYVSLAEGKTGQSSIDRLGAWFTDYIPYQQTNHGAPRYQSNAILDVSSPEGVFLSDTIEWMKVCGYYMAKGGEKHMLLGNILSSNVTNWNLIKYNATSFSSFYYFDDITVREATEAEYNLLAEDTITTCANVPISLEAQGGYSYYAWNTGDTTHLLQPDTTGMYRVDGITGYCHAMDSVYVIIEQPINALPLKDTTLCITDYPYTFHLSDTLGTINWNNESTGNEYALAAPGNLGVQIQNNCGVYDFQYAIEKDTLPPLELGADTLVCDSTTYQQTLKVPTYFDSVLWEDHQTNFERELTHTGKYKVTAQHKCGSRVDSIQVNYETHQQFSLGADTVYCETIALELPTGYTQTKWIQGPEPHKVKDTLVAEATNSCGIWRDSVTVTQYLTPNLFLVPEPIRCNGQVLSPLWIEASNGFEEYIWNTGASGKGLYVEESGIYEVTARHYCGTSNASIEISPCYKGDYYLEIPNVITPNGDGINDCMDMIYENIVPGELKVFNRWNSQVYAGAYERFCPESLKDGTYYYQFSFKNKTNERQEIVKGWVMIVK